MIEVSIAEIRAKTLEEVRALVAAEQLDIDASGSGGCETCGYGTAEYRGYTLDKINEILDKAKVSKPLWEK